jgi:hypothetical protein
MVNTFSDLRTKRHFSTFDTLSLSQTFECFTPTGRDLDIAQCMVISLMSYGMNFITGGLAVLKTKNFNDMARMIVDAFLYLTDIPIIFGVLAKIDVLKNDIIVAIWLFISLLVYFIILIRNFSSMFDMRAGTGTVLGQTASAARQTTAMFLLNFGYHVVLMYLFWILFIQALLAYEVPRLEIILVFQISSELHRIIGQMLQKKPLIIGNIIISAADILIYVLQLNREILQFVLPVKIMLKLFLEYFSDGTNLIALQKSVSGSSLFKSVNKS